MFWPFASEADIVEYDEAMSDAHTVAAVYVWHSMRAFGRPDMVQCVSLTAAANNFPGEMRWMPS